MAPELFLRAPASVRTDLFSLGVTLYQMLTAEHPFLGRETNGQGMPVFRADPLRRVISEKDARLPSNPSLIQKCLALDPEWTAYVI